MLGLELQKKFSLSAHWIIKETQTKQLSPLVLKAAK